jgi:antitoxin (DNA-binding transcriptional repressor) of toxin-antitoxin stability system
MARPGKKNGAVPAPAGAAGGPEIIEVKAGVFKDTCLSLMDEVRTKRRQYIITKHGRAVAKLVPPDLEVPSAFGFLRGMLVEQDDIVSPDFEPWGDAT